MLPDRVSNPGPLTYESGALPIALRGPACNIQRAITPKTGNPELWFMYSALLYIYVKVHHYCGHCRILKALYYRSIHHCNILVGALVVVPGKE